MKINFEKGSAYSTTIFVLFFLLVAGVITFGLIYYYSIKDPTPVPSGEDVLIKVSSPLPDQEIQSPILVKGEAKGQWFFEATFPIKLLDENGNIIKQTFAQAEGEWMTENFVPFESVLTFSVDKNQKGTLVLEKDNPSGLSENAREIRIPVNLSATKMQANFSETGNLVKNNPGFKSGVWYLVYEKAGSPALNVEIKFSGDSTCKIDTISQPCQQIVFENGDKAVVVGWIIDGALIVKNMVVQKAPTQLRTVTLYYYNPNLDKDITGNTLCSRNGLVAVDRQIPITNTPVQDTINLLILGNITNAEKSQGVTTEYPLQGFKLAAASLNNSTLTLTFNDPNNKTGGGACRAGILWFQIEATAKQFIGVSSVRFMPEELFQP